MIPNLFLPSVAAELVRAPAPSEGAQPAASTDFLLMLGRLAADAVQGGAGRTSASPFTDAGDAQDFEEASEGLDVLGALAITAPAAPLELGAPPEAAAMRAAANVAADAVDVELNLARGAALQSGAAAQTQLAFFDAGAPEAAVEASFDSALSPSVDMRQSPQQTLSNPEVTLARPVQAQVGGSAWADEIGARLMLMTEQGKHTASLRLSPEHLGPLEIRIAIHEDQASVWFGAAHADTRAAIEHALPRLRELFEAQGMSLADAGVSGQAPREQASVRARDSGDVGVEGSDQPAEATEASVKVGLLDAYA